MHFDICSPREGSHRTDNIGAFEGHEWTMMSLEVVTWTVGLSGGLAMLISCAAFSQCFFGSSLRFVSYRVPEYSPEYHTSFDKRRVALVSECFIRPSGAAFTTWTSVCNLGTGSSISAEAPGAAPGCACRYIDLPTLC